VAALAPPVAATRTAVRDCFRDQLRDRRRGDLVLVACSGGADSVALARATAFVALREGLRAGLVTIDHGLQPGSRDRAEHLVSWANAVGFTPALAVTIDVSATGEGPEAAARDARYAALAQVAEQHGAAAVLLGHTRDDQAETVLLALARGAGPRGLAGMPSRRIIAGAAFLRPFLSIARTETLAACTAQDEAVWDDPHNHDPKFTRVRVREAMSTLVEVLGADVVANLARTAGLLASDVTALDDIAEHATVDVTTADGALVCAGLAALPPAVRTRVLRSFALGLGAPGGSLASTHVSALDALVVSWHGQGAVALPGGIQVARREGRLEVA
jgi:tRNA(Ile)-lysidine synthase